MKVGKLRCKSLLNQSKLADYCINPYIGCQHACRYCYAEFITKKFTKHGEAWGEFVDVKINAPLVLKKEISKKRGRVLISSLTDPYQPLERKFELTRKILEVLLAHRFPVSIQTKSSLVLRDLDLIEKSGDIEVGLTITTLEDEIRKKFEPHSSSIEERLGAIEILKQHGIKTYVFFGPLLPYLSDLELENYFELMRKLKVDLVFVDKLNLKPGIWKNLVGVLKDYNLLDKWKDIFFGKNDYYAELKARIGEVSKSYGVACAFCY
jgi:DNA repair photolyase